MNIILVVQREHVHTCRQGFLVENFNHQPELSNEHLSRTNEECTALCHCRKLWLCFAQPK